MDELTIQSDTLQLTFEPEQGGKWRSLKDRRTGREWLWENPYLSQSPIRYGDSFIQQHDTGGWDEICPSVSPFGNIPDHGDLAQLPWQVDAHTDSRLRMSVKGRCFPFHFERTVSVHGSEIRCDYQIRNIGEQPFPWLWCAHPLLPLSKELSVEVDGRFKVVQAFAAAHHLEGSRIRLDALSWGETTWAAKLFSERSAIDHVTVRHDDGTGLRFTWDSRQIPYLGLWINHGAWSGCDSAPYFNLGIEPTTVPADDLSDVPNPPILKPAERVEWSLKISLI